MALNLASIMKIIKSLDNYQLKLNYFFYNNKRCIRVIYVIKNLNMNLN